MGSTIASQNVSLAFREVFEITNTELWVEGNKLTKIKPGTWKFEYRTTERPDYHEFHLEHEDFSNIVSKSFFECGSRFFDFSISNFSMRSPFLPMKKPSPAEIIKSGNKFLILCNLGWTVSVSVGRDQNDEIISLIGKDV